MSENQGKNILLVGDSHTDELISAYKFSRKEYTITHRNREIRSELASKHRIDKYAQFHEENCEIGMFKSWGTAWAYDASGIDNISTFNNQNSHCIFWLGFNDILRHELYPDFDKTIRKYLSTIINTFDNTNIHIAYPLKTRHMIDSENYHLFCQKLNDLCLEYDLDKPLDMGSGKEDVLKDPNEYQDLHHLNSYHYESMFLNLIKYIDEEI